MKNRSHRRAEKAARDRAVIRFCMEYYDRCKYSSEPNHRYVELEEPIFWGYRRYFVLRDGITSENKAHRWLTILKTIQKVEESPRKDFKVRNRQEKGWKENPHRLKVLRFQQLQREIPSRWHRFFGYRASASRRKYYFLMPQLFESKTTKLYITHRLELDREYEKHQSFLSRVIYDRGYNYTYDKMRGWSYEFWPKDWVLPKDRIRDRLAREEIKEGLLAHYHGELIQAI